VKSSTLIYTSILLLSLGLILAYSSLDSEKIQVINYNYSNIAFPPVNWQEYYWSALVYGKPNATIITPNQTIFVNNVSEFPLNETTKYVYIVSGYIQPYAYLSPLALFLVLTGTFVGFKGTILYFQSRVLGEELTKGYAVGGSLYRYFLKRFSSFLFSAFLIISVVILVKHCMVDL